jgi:hypothetical protein
MSKLDSARPRQRCLAVRRVLHGVAGALEVLGERARHVQLVLDEQDAGARVAHPSVRPEITSE